jgi:hypothetical protein
LARDRRRSLIGEGVAGIVVRVAQRPRAEKAVLPSMLTTGLGY